MRKKSVTLHKTNEMVRGGDNLSLHAKRLVNTIYLVVQHNINQGGQKKEMIENLEYIPIDFPTLRKFLGLENVESYVSEIEAAFKELFEPMELHNFKDPRDGYVYKWFATSFVSEVKWRYDDRKRVALFKLTPLIKHLMLNTHLGGNFTPINLIPTINKFRTKYAMKLYEFLKSFGNYRYVDINQKHLMRLFGISDDNKTYRYYADIKRLLERQIRELVNKSDLTLLQLDNSPALKKEKVFRIIINPKAEQKTVKQDTAEDIINKLSINRF